MWEKMTDRIEELGGEVRLETPATEIEVEDGARRRAIHTPRRGHRAARDVISSLPLRTTVGIADPAAPAGGPRGRAQGLRYRDFLTVALILDGEDLFPDNWIYIHEADVSVGRIQNYRSWSPWMVPDPDTACVGLEYFCFKGDELWTMADDDLVALATRELEQLGLAQAEQVRRGYVVRVPKAYPMYDDDYAERVATIRRLARPARTDFEQVGRNGLHRYNNSDHSMLSAMRAVDNVLRRRPATTSGRSTSSRAYHEEQTDARHAAALPRRCHDDRVRLRAAD